MSGAVVAFGFPNPFDLVGGVFDGLLGAGGAMMNSAIGEAVSWLVESVLGALVDLAVAALVFFWNAAEPETGAAWFSGSGSTPYGDMVALAAPLLVVFLFAGVIQGVLRGDTAGMLRMTLVRLPGAVLAMAITVTGTDLLLRVSDEMSKAVLGGFRDDVEATTQMLGTVATVPGPGGAAQFLMIVFGLIGLLAAVLLVIELFVRAALIYIVVALSPLIYAASVWESMKGAIRKLAEVGLALILSKFVISVALALSASAMTAAWGGGTTATEITTPEAAAAASVGAGGGLGQNVGVLVGSIVMFGVAAFMPFVLFRLLPLAEGALVSQGIKGGPVRAMQQGSNAAMTARYNPATAGLVDRSSPGAAAQPASVGAGSAAPGGAGGGPAVRPTGSASTPKPAAAPGGGAGGRPDPGRDPDAAAPAGPGRGGRAPAPAPGSQSGRTGSRRGGAFPIPPAPSLPVPGAVGGVLAHAATNTTGDRSIPADPGR